MSAGPNNLRTYSELGGVAANTAMSAIGEEVSDENSEEEKKQWMKKWKFYKKQLISKHFRKI